MYPSGYFDANDKRYSFGCVSLESMLLWHLSKHEQLTTTVIALPDIPGNNAHDIDDCSPINPCKSGTCIDRVNGFTCSCPTGVTGLRCDVYENNHPNCTIPTNKLRDCKDVYESGQWRGKGVHTINGFGKTSVLCDRTPDGKVWTVLMYRHDASLNFTDKNYIDYIFGSGIRHFSLLNVNAAGACGYDFPCDGGRLVRAYLRQRRGTI